MVKSAAGFLISGSWIATEAVVGKVVGIATAKAVGRCWSSLPFSLTIPGTATSVTGIKGSAGPTKITGGLQPILQILLAGHLAVPQGSGSCSQAVGHAGKTHLLSAEQQTASTPQVGCLQNTDIHIHIPICRQKVKGTKTFWERLGPPLWSQSHTSWIFFSIFSILFILVWKLLLIGITAHYLFLFWFLSTFLNLSEKFVIIFLISSISF